MERLIVITGTPGTGKSTLAKYIGSKVKADVIEANRVAKENKLVIGKDIHGTSIIDIGRLEKRLNAIAKEHSRKNKMLVLEGHLLSEIKVSGATAIVIREHLPILIRRLEKRKYHFDKIRDNIISEAIDFCGSGSRKRYGKVYEIQGGKTAKAEALKIIKYGRGSKSSIDMMPELLKLIKKNKDFLS